MDASDPQLEAAGHELADRLLARRHTIATAESCTGGWVAKVLTDRAGSSAYMVGGLVTYSNEAKQQLLGDGDRDQVRRQAVCFALRGVSEFLGEP